ncbi:hypothetical protein GALMADRAFT_1123082 [Galerina marginata CBS 339.88]|uniref:Uncharacterized protein n=1 Tax=Galerina marginata (strain CBS 339.88) TaxID=685588 RepID=A0A067TML1_GALM3|nr:hypothetical protein GALMADRAFT_1123082 [Galerina marginata CBS 339.88]
MSLLHVSCAPSSHPPSSSFFSAWSYIAYLLSALFMPGELSADEFYYHYQASQRRVELWVQETGKELQDLQGVQQGLGPPPAQQPQPTVAAQKEKVSHSVETRQRDGRTSSKQRTDDQSRSRPSSGSKKIRHSERHSKPSSRSSRRRTTPDRDITITSYLPYGVLPLMYAVTGSTALSVIVALILLAGYLCVDYETQRPSSKKTLST